MTQAQALKIDEAGAPRPQFTADRLPGTITARVTAAANAAFMIETMMVSNVLPPIIATVVSIGFIGMI
ncbi:MAG TPA: hypothetical protein VGG27_18235, partial [Magnetospirillaceae bacterium]